MLLLCETQLSGILDHFKQLWGGVLYLKGFIKELLIVGKPLLFILQQIVVGVGYIIIGGDLVEMLLPRSDGLFVML